MAKNSRADYFKKRREEKKSFNVLLDRQKVEKFEVYLSKQNKTKSKWLNEKIDEELEKEK